MHIKIVNKLIIDSEQDTACIEYQKATPCTGHSESSVRSYVSLIDNIQIQIFIATLYT